MEDNWLNKKKLVCDNCKNKLIVCDHSPYENSYRLYCDSCPVRVDISIYDSIFDKLDLDKLDYGELMLEFEKRLLSCVCGGKFKMNSKRRCLYCNETLNLDEVQNVWLDGMWEDDENEDEIEEQMSNFIVEPRWKSID